VVHKPQRDDGQVPVARPRDEVAAAGHVVEMADTRGVVLDVPEKSTDRALLCGGHAYDWTNAMMSWQQ
jgi:hypothetical protein